MANTTKITYDGTATTKKKNWKEDKLPERTEKTTTSITPKDVKNAIRTSNVTGYDYNKKNYSGETVTTTVTTKNPETNQNETRNKVVKNFNNASTKTVTRKILDKDGNELGTVTKKVKTNDFSGQTKKVTSTVSRKGAGNFISESPVSSATEKVANELKNSKNWKNWYETSNVIKSSKSGRISSYDDYAKTATGVVTNTSSSAYEHAREAKKIRVAEELANEDARLAVDVLKKEVPIDIAELKAKVQMIMNYLGLVEDSNDMNDDDFVELENKTKAQILAKKGELGAYITNVFNLNGSDTQGQTTNQRLILYSNAHYLDAFMNNRYNTDISDAEYAQKIADFINKLVEDNSGWVHFMGHPMAGLSDEDKFIEWANYALLYMKNLFVGNGCIVPETVTPP